MLSPKKYLLPLLLLITAGFSLYTGHVKHLNSRNNSLTLSSFVGDESGVAADITADDDVLYADDDDSDDVSESVFRLLPVAIVSFFAFFFFQSLSFAFAPGLIPVKRATSPSFLKVFRI